MKKIKSIKIKPGFSRILKIFGIIFCILLGLFIFYSKQIHELTNIGYSREASRKILFSFQKEYVLSVGENKTLNAAFMSDAFQEKNMDHYVKIKYVHHKHFIEHINQLLKKGYSDSDINIIFAHGDDAAVGRFLKRDKIRYLEEFYVVDYAKLDNYDRYVAYSDETGEDEETTVLFVNLDFDKEDYQDSTLVEKFSTEMLINKHHHVGEKFVPDELVKIGNEYASEEGMECSKVALDAFQKMSAAAMKDGYEIVINSAYRSYQDQVDITEEYLKWYGQNYVDKYVAKPGYSEHQSGLAFDIGSRKVNVFANSKEYEWMLENAYKYGFILRFSKKDEDITGFRSEPWHYRYVGEKIAKYIYEHDITFEEYWAMFLDER